MAVDKLQDRIRKLKNPSVIDLNMLPEHIPPHISERDTDFATAYSYCCEQILDGLQNVVPAVRLSMNAMMLYGGFGLQALSNLLRKARELGYYVFLDVPGAYSAIDAQRSADVLLDGANPFCFDALVLSDYIGSDGIRPFCDKLNDSEKDLFVLARTANKSAFELQDLLSGTRLMHMAAADVIGRYADAFLGRYQYSQIGVTGSATASDSLRNLRNGNPNLFLLVDGYDMSGANAKNCSAAFDALGHGAIVCAGTGVTAAWMQSPADAEDYVAQAVEAATRMCKNLTRYITIL